MAEAVVLKNAVHKLIYGFAEPQAKLLNILILPDLQAALMGEGEDLFHIASRVDHRASHQGQELGKAGFHLLEIATSGEENMAHKLIEQTVRLALIAGGNALEKRLFLVVRVHFRFGLVFELHDIGGDMPLQRV